MSDLMIGPPQQLVPVRRPNGKMYRPRRLPRAVEVDNAGGHSGWIFVVGTHDVERAGRLAQQCYRQVDLSTAEYSWMRLTMRDGDRRGRG